MELVPLFSNELEQEAETTQKFLKLVPDEKFDWNPHQKSMTLKELTVHIAEIPGWIETVLNQDVLDFADGYEPTPVENSNDLIELLEQSVQKSKEALNGASEDDLLPDWTMKNGDQILMVMPRHEIIRHSLSQIIHHRAQLGVYLRLLDIPIPGSYGPSADEQSF
ncbi:DinB family protein [Aliifodinibius salicampi]|uniref:DinB family protein n=1 Tax=Fodinibius salicampi TaxID=1920655 RepID=A0ABT3PXF7_9BACT|nr:DinB family protein [Fodinibius salicampi]MCW9712537.1 DinB family protein [Fodinibius salicampi]